jgi:hypothetical protein
VSKQYILNSNLRLYAPRFAKELLRDEGMAAGFLDSRYAQKEFDNASEFPNSDPFDAKTGPIYVSLLHQYLRNGSRRRHPGALPAPERRGQPELKAAEERAQSRLCNRYYGIDENALSG